MSVPYELQLLVSRRNLHIFSIVSRHQTLDLQGISERIQAGLRQSNGASPRSISEFDRLQASVILGFRSSRGSMVLHSVPWLAWLKKQASNGTFPSILGILPSKVSSWVIAEALPLGRQLLLVYGRGQELKRPW